MASNSITAQRMAWLDEKGEDWIGEEILECGTVIAFCRKHFDVHSDDPHARAGHSAFYKWKDQGGEERQEWFKRLKKYRAAHRAELATDRMDNSTLSNYKHMEAKARQDMLLAKKLDREEFGDGPQVQINNNNIEIGSLLANALAQIEETTTPPVLEAKVEDE